MFRNLFSAVTSFFNDRTSGNVKNGAGKYRPGTTELKNEKNTSVKSRIFNSKVFEKSPSSVAFRKIQVASIPRCLETSDADISEETLEVPSPDTLPWNLESASTEQELLPVVVTSFGEPQDDSVPEIVSLLDPILRQTDRISEPAVPQTTQEPVSPESQYSQLSLEPREPYPFLLAVTEDTTEDAVAEIPTGLINAFQADVHESSAPTARSGLSHCQVSGFCVDTVLNSPYNELISAIFDLSVAPGPHTDELEFSNTPAELSFHELITGDMKRAYEISARVFHGSKGHPITENNYQYDSVNQKVTHMDEVDIVRRCPIVNLSVVEHLEGVDLPRDHLFHYAANRVLGLGGFGCAVLYMRRPETSTSTPQDVADVMPKFMALKFLLNPDHEQHISSHLNEFNHMLALKGCPWTVPCLGDYDTHNKASRIPPAIIMPYYRATLSMLLREVPRPELDKVVLVLLAQLIVAVHNLHQRGVLHLDLKPENIFISNTGHIVLGDMGLSRYVAGPSGLISSSDVGGTALYMAPEITFDKVCGREADWYSVGVIAYQMLTGEAHPFKPNNLKNGLREPKPFHTLSHPEGEFILGLLERDVDQRLTFHEMTDHSVFEKLDWNEVHGCKGNELVRQLLTEHF